MSQLPVFFSSGALLSVVIGCDLHFAREQVSAEAIAGVQATRDEYMKTVQDVFGAEIKGSGVAVASPRTLTVSPLSC